jgi:hypothetical protein
VQQSDADNGADNGADERADNQAADQATDQPEDLPEPMPALPYTGDEVIDQATAALTQAMREPLELQVQAYERAHRTLQDRLADVES